MFTQNETHSFWGILFILTLIAVALYKSYKKKYRPRFILKYIYNTIDGATKFFHLNNKHMKQVTFNGPAAAGKHTIARFTLSKDEAGNFPDLVEGSLRAETSDESVATAEVGDTDAANGVYTLKTTYTGKKGNVITKLVASPDLDGSGDEDIEAPLLSVITTGEAKSFNDDDVEVSELLD
jgi:hypothetical protein